MGCRGRCPTQDMTPVQLLEFTYVRFKMSVLGLMLLISAFLFFHIFHHTVSIVVLVYTLVYIVVLNVGMRGATNKHIGMIRFYWVFQVVQLVVFLLTVLAIVVMCSYWHAARMHHQPANPVVTHHDVAVLPTETQGDLPKTADLPKTEDVPKVGHADYHQRFSAKSLVPMIWPAILFFVIVFTITRTIVLARQLIALIEATAGMTDVELQDCCKESESDCKKWCDKEESKKPAAEAVPAAPSVAVYSPEAVYIMPQSFAVGGEGAYPAQLMPVYVDKFGQSSQ